MVSSSSVRGTARISGVVSTNSDAWVGSMSIQESVRVGDYLSVADDTSLGPIFDCERLRLSLANISVSGRVELEYTLSSMNFARLDSRVSAFSFVSKRDDSR